MAPLRIWVAADHHAAFRCGGWAFVREAGGGLSGTAGGERNTTAARTALAGLAAALADLPAGDAVVLMADRHLLAHAALAAGADPGEDAPTEDLDLWARILAAGKGRTLRVARADPTPGGPAAFCAAWADLARDKAKATGAFTAQIPRPNLAKVKLD